MSEDAAVEPLPGAAEPEPVAPPQVPVTVRPQTVEAATFQALMDKGRRREEFKVPRPSGGVLVVKAEAISHRDYDQLVAECPPTEREIRVGTPFELRKFGPRLLAACLTQPTLTVDQARQLWENPDWAEGEIIGLFNRVNQMCQRGLDVPFIAPG